MGKRNSEQRNNMDLKVAVLSCLSFVLTVQQAAGSGYNSKQPHALLVALANGGHGSGRNVGYGPNHVHSTHSSYGNSHGHSHGGYGNSHGHSHGGSYGNSHGSHGHRSHGFGHRSHGIGHSSHGIGHSSHGIGHLSHGIGHSSHGIGHSSHGIGHSS